MEEAYKLAVAPTSVIELCNHSDKASGSARPTSAPKIIRPSILLSSASLRHNRKLLRCSSNLLQNRHQTASIPLQIASTRPDSLPHNQLYFDATLATRVLKDP